MAKYVNEQKINKWGGVGGRGGKVGRNGPKRKWGGPPKEKVEWAKGILNGAKSGVEKSSILKSSTFNRR